MNASQVHRGPDEEGVYVDPDLPVCLAMRRLSIIDQEYGRQPMRSGDSSVVLVFNGEIFNARALRDVLVKEDYRFFSHHSDTEALLNLYLHAGTRMVSQLNGMFAFCIFDRRTQKLFAARDPFGIKPFFYSTSGNTFAFASEIKSLLQCPWIGRDLNPQAAYDYFTFQTIAAPQTIYSSVRKLPAGHCLEYNLATHDCRVWEYWRPIFSEKRLVPRSERRQQIRTSFVSAVQRWSQSDVPIACSLSGGIDSAAIVAALATSSGRAIDTYTVGFSDQSSLDETAIARVVARKWATNHHEVIIDSDTVVDCLDRMLHHLDEPYAGGLPSWFVYQAMQKSFRVALTGTGGDELFGNYGKWRKYLSLRDRLRSVRNYRSRGGSLSHALRYPHGSLHYPYFTDGDKRHRLFSKDFLCGLRSSAHYVEHLWQPSLSAVDAVTLTDLSLQLPEEFLMMTDRFSMAFSIEARTPFLDMEFAAQVYELPANERCDATQLKGLFVESMGDWLPAEVTKSPKRGFVLPQAAWLRGVLREQLLELTEPGFLRQQGIFRDSIRTTVVKPFLEGLHDRDWESWTLLMFQLWSRARASAR
jgi:asparagine synthase (glutamine-hydrolysing)